MDVMCFKYQGYGCISSQCPSKMNMIVLDSGNVESKHSSDDEMRSLEGLSDDEYDGPSEVEAPYRDMLVTQKTLNIQPKE